MSIYRKKHSAILALMMLSLLSGCTVHFGTSGSSVSSNAPVSSSSASSSQNATSSDNGASSTGDSSSTSSSTSSATSSAPTSSSNSTSSSSSSSAAGASLTLSLAKTSIKEGTNFYDACKPSVVYMDGTSTTTLDATSSLLSFTLKKGTTSYTLGSRLAVGSYTASVTYKAKDVSASANFEVVASNPIAATEGHGYTTPTTFTNAMTSYPNLSALGSTPLDAIGSRKILVIPVYFSRNATFSASELSVIDKAYNGTSADTGWESLSSYYAKSSYNKLSLRATIASPYCYSKTDAQMTSASKAGGENAYGGLVDDLAIAAIKAVSSSLNLSDFDEDSDGS